MKKGDKGRASINFEAISTNYGWDKDEEESFQRFLEEYKERAGGGSAASLHFTWQELNLLAQHHLGLIGDPEISTGTRKPSSEDEDED